MKQVLGCIRRADQDFGMIQPGDRVAVGVSGGKDSLLLLKALALYRKFAPNPFELTAITVSMGREPFDLSGVQAMCDELGVPYVVKQTQIGGYGYIGYLSIPALKLDLPIMGEWDYHRLRIAPCRYVGSVQGNDLVIMAHNYNSHFGRLSKLSEGDRVTFTDMDGILTTYEVIALDILNPYAVEEVTSGDFDLTLFTCTYGGESRVTVYCDKVTQ